MQPIHIEITSLVTGADAETLVERTDVTRRLENLGQINAADGQVNTQATAWQATINGVTVPLAGFAVEPADAHGQALVSLVVPADAVSVGRSPASVPAPSEKPKVAAWGQDVKDPRESIAGWVSDLAEQTAVHGEQSVRSRMERLGLMDPPDGGSQPSAVPA